MSNFCADCRPGTLQALSKSRSQTSTHMRHSRNSGDRSRTNCEWVDSVNDTDRDSGVHPEDIVRLYLRVVFTCQIGAAAAISLKLHPMACQLLGRSACPMGSPIIIPAFNRCPHSFASTSSTTINASLIVEHTAALQLHANCKTMSVVTKTNQDVGDAKESTTIRFEWTLRGLKNLFETRYVGSIQRYTSCRTNLIQQRRGEVEGHEVP